MLARVVRGRSREVHPDAKTAPVPSAPQRLPFSFSQLDQDGRQAARLTSAKPR
jgi:hypothetical protein